MSADRSPERPKERAPGRRSSVLAGGGPGVALALFVALLLGWAALGWLTKPYDGVHASPPPAPLAVTPYAQEPLEAGPAVEPPPWDRGAVEHAK